MSKNKDEYDYKKIVEPLLEWYDIHKRTLPWRVSGNPYYTWVSEIMLQQTRVEAVKGYFARFIGELPTVEALAQASEEQILKLWEGLGYYNRVRNMQSAAITIMEEYQGRIPEEYETLKTLKGIGNYTAGAIASIAYGKRVPAVDGNVLRVMKRLAGSYEDIAKASVKTNLEKQLFPIMPERAGEFNQAIMDLGAMVCLPNGKPLCDTCPLKELCMANLLGIQQELPVKAPKKARKIEEKTVLLLECKGKYAIRKREKKGLLAGLWELPSVEGKCKKEELYEILKEGEQTAKIAALGEAKHIFSHIEWSMVGYAISLEEQLGQKDLLWISAEELKKEYAIPSAFAAYTRYIWDGF